MTFNTIPQDMMSPLVVGEGIRVWVMGGDIDIPTKMDAPDTTPFFPMDSG